jgi:hypothetical protein
MQIDDLWKDHLRQARSREALGWDPRAWATALLRGKSLTVVIEEMTGESERQTLLVLMAAAEAGLQARAEDLAVAATGTPLGDRMANVRADAHAFAIKKGWHDQAPKLASILKAWDDDAKVRGDTVVPTATGLFRELFGVRNWLAHGRHWAPPPLPDPAGAWSTIQTLFGALGITMPPIPTAWV